MAAAGVTCHVTTQVGMASALNTIVSMMRQGRLTAPGLIQPIVSLEEGHDVWRLIESEPNKVIKFAVQF